MANATVDSRGDRPLPPHLGPNRGDRQRTKTAPSSTRTTPVASDAETPPKRQKGLVSEGSVPSLLSRLALAPGEIESKRDPLALVPAKRRAETEGVQQQTKRPTPQRGRVSSLHGADLHAPAEVGFSIKGAAARAKQPTPEAVVETHVSLLNRLNRNDQGGGSSARRKRTKT